MSTFLDAVCKHVPSDLWPLVLSYAFGPLDKLRHEFECCSISLSFIGVYDVTNSNFSTKMQLPALVRDSMGLCSVMPLGVLGLQSRKMDALFVKHRHVVYYMEDDRRKTSAWYLMTLGSAIQYLLDTVRAVHHLRTPQLLP
jgi:hypothetical protein